ncbi:MAG: hypothetical protein ACLFMV_02255 [Spirochaetaceae bacterium]
MQALFLGVVVLAMASFFMFQHGMRVNRDIARATVRTLEETFRPQQTEYRNIGGTIGWHFTYILDEPITKVRGLFTLVPRQAMFYMPIARLMGREDELHVSFYSARFRPVGEGHIVVPSRLKAWWAQIEDQEEFDEVREERDGREFVILSHNRFVREKLQWFLADLSSVAGLRQFACFRRDDSYLLVLSLREADLPEMINSVRKRIPQLRTHFA